MAELISGTLLGHAASALNREKLLMAENDNGKRDKGIVPRRRNGKVSTSIPAGLNSSGGGIPPLQDHVSGTLRTHGRIVRRHMGIILSALLLGMIVSAGVALFKKPVYRARTSIEIEGFHESFLNMRDVNPAAPNSIADTHLQTQVKILQSESLSQRVLASMETLPEDLRQRSWTQAGWIQELKLPYFTVPDKADLQLSQVMRHLTVRPVAQTRMIEVLFDSSDAEFAAGFANLLAAEYVKRSMEQRWSAISQTQEWLKPQLLDLKEKLQRSGRELQASARSSARPAANGKMSPAEQGFHDLRTELSKAQRERTARQLLYERVSAGPADSMPAVGIAGPMREYQIKLSGLKRQHAELAVSVTPDRYKMGRLEAHIFEFERLVLDEWFQVLKRILNDYTTALRREQVLSEALATQARTEASQSPLPVQHDVFKRGMAGNQQLHDVVLQKIQEAAVASAVQTANPRVLDQARVPSLPYKPNLPWHTGIGSALGLFAGLGLAAIRERANGEPVEPGKISVLLNVPELGVIPSARFDPEQRISSRHLLPFFTGNGEPLELVTLRHKPSLLAESYRTILTSILFSKLDGKCPQIITFTSPRSREGKTTVVSNLGIALAEINLRVLLIDGDLRNPRLSGVFNVTNSWGLTDILNSTDPIEEMPIEALVRQTEVPGLMLLPSGPATANLFAMLHSPRFHTLLRRFRKHFEAVLIDSCSMSHLQDARVLGGLSDAVILVVRSQASSPQDVREVLERLREDHTLVLGLVLNDMDPRKRGRNLDQYYDPNHTHYSGISL
jgi:capsular exopolysaccharide synthesis family protein